ncbi:translation initiation factor IF-6 [Candidatus Hecatella orcuttiae]|uniref:translation initiation factor IF-6 n=1 Tax=Candidatus Hecatella orcuttiae TaxID=1935119 RepID=UPI0028682B76|nr:translation initiation factor IF-6 [Candidatus Hecatella orcuttiae]
MSESLSSGMHAAEVSLEKSSAGEWLILAIIRYSIFGSPNIGIYSLATDKFVMLPAGVSARKIERAEKVLKVKAVSLDLGYSKLIGILAAANSHGIILPHYISDEEVSFIRKQLDVRVDRLNSKHTSLGNLILANDRGAVVAPLFSRREVRRIEETLAVDAASSPLVGLPLPGSLAVATNQGALVHPEASEEEKKLLSEVLKVPVSVGTINGGVTFLSSGILINSHGALVGAFTTGPELMGISAILPSKARSRTRDSSKPLNRKS